jgi:hypothetical protein
LEHHFHIVDLWAEDFIMRKFCEHRLKDVLLAHHTATSHCRWKMLMTT